MQADRQRKIVIAGGTGRIGHLLAKHFHGEGQAVATLSRFPKPQPWLAVHWDAETRGEWVTTLEAADAVISCGVKSRLADRVMEQALAQCGQPPAVWLRAGAVPRDKEDAAGLRVRTVSAAIGTIVSGEVGAFPRLLRLVRLGLSRVGYQDNQTVAWIHETDFVRAVEFVIEADDLKGRVEMAAPEDVSLQQLVLSLRELLGIEFGSWGLPVWAVQWAAPELVIRDRKKAVDYSLYDAGFRFLYPEWPAASATWMARLRAAERV